MCVGGAGAASRSPPPAAASRTQKRRARRARRRREASEREARQGERGEARRTRRGEAKSSLSVDRGASTASGGNFKVGKCDSPLPPASSAFPSPPFSLPPFTLAQELIGEPGTRIRVGTLDGAGACAGRAGCWEPLAPGSSFCWGPELQGSTSPSSSWSMTPRRAGQDQRKVRRARAPAPPCAPQPPRPPNARIPHLPATLHRPRAAALHTSLPPHPRLPLCVRRRSILPFYLDQGRGRRAEAARRRRRRPCGPGGRLGAQGGRGLWGLLTPSDGHTLAIDWCHLDRPCHAWHGLGTHDTHRI